MVIGFKIQFNLEFILNTKIGNNPFGFNMCIV